MKHTIYYTRKQVWGNELFYPACKTSELLLSLTGRKTLQPQDFKTIRELGYEFVELHGRPV
jgi:hypothetical protein